MIDPRKKRDFKRTAWALALLVLSAVPAFGAGLQARSTTPDATTGGHPTWYQDTAGVAAAPCLDNLGFCGLVPDATFNGTVPATFPGNIPEEWFYWSATALFPVNGADALVVLALEAVYLDQFGVLVPPNTAGALPATFQRLRVILDNAPVAGTYTVEHPWGATTFTCAAPGLCKFTRDLGGAIPNDFDTALGNGVFTPPDTSMSTFLIQAGTAPPGGYFGDGASITTVTGGTVRNSVAILSPTSTNIGGTSLFAVTGKKIGVEVLPTSVNLGPAVIPATSAPQRVTVNNVTGNPILFPTLATAGASAAEFAITAPATGTTPFCSGATVSAGASCAFDLTFTPADGATAARTATIAVAPTTVQPAPPPATQLPDPPPVTVNVSGTAQYPLKVTVPTSVGGKVDSSVAGISACAAGPCVAGFNTGSSVTLIPTGAGVAPLSLFDSWGGDCTGSGACTLTMNAAKTVTASFVRAFNVTTSATPSAGGTITASQVTATGSSPTVIISPNACYHISSLTDNGTPATATPVTNTTSFSYDVANVTADRTVAVAFSNQQAVTRTAGANGTITGPATVTCGAANTSYSVAPNAKFKVKDITLNGSAQTFTPASTVGGAVTFTIASITADQTLAATFMPSGDVDGNGAIDVSDALKALKIYLGVEVPHGDDLAAMKVTPLDANGKPNGTGNPDLHDVVTILKRVVGLITW